MKLIFTLAISLLTVNAFSAMNKNFKFNRVGLTGKGCPLSETSIIESPDQNAVSILFDSFSVEVPQYRNNNDNNELGGSEINNPRLDYKVCNMDIDTELSEGEQISSVEISVDLRGGLILEGDARAEFRSLVIGMNGLGLKNKNSNNYIANESWDNTLSNNEWIVSKTMNIPVQSGCGKPNDGTFNLKIKNIILAKLARRSDLSTSFATLALDSADLVGQYKIKVHTKKCNNLPDSRGRTRTPTPSNGRVLRTPAPGQILRTPSRSVCSLGLLMNARTGQCYAPAPGQRGRR